MKITFKDIIRGLGFTIFFIALLIIGVASIVKIMIISGAFHSLGRFGSGVCGFIIMVWLLFIPKVMDLLLQIWGSVKK